ncbi:MAG: hypothetical protein AAF573_04270 [Bacteroidota bacterium]
MNYTKFLFFLCVTFLISSCEMETNSNTANNAIAKTDDTPLTKAAPAPKTDNWLIIPGKQVGRIQADFKDSDIYKMFGEDNVSETEIGLGEGETKKGLLVFPRTKNELQILFEGNEKMEKIESIKIRGEDSMWKTDNGISVGTTLEELVKLNGRDFKFYGFEWDYAGKLANWDNGNLSDQLSLYLVATNEEAVFPHLLGDKEFSSSEPKAREAGLKVSSLEIEF